MIFNWLPLDLPMLVFRKKNDPVKSVRSVSEAFKLFFFHVSVMDSVATENETNRYAAKFIDTQKDELR